MTKSQNVSPLERTQMQRESLGTLTSKCIWPLKEREPAVYLARMASLIVVGVPSFDWSCLEFSALPTGILFDPQSTS